LAPSVRKRWTVPLVLALFLSSVAAAPGGATGAPEGGSLDDFEGYSSSEEVATAYSLWSEDGSPVPRTLTSDSVGDGTYALSVESQGSVSGWASLSRALDGAKRDWSEFQGISFWVRVEGEGIQFNLELVDDGAHPSFNLTADGYFYTKTAEEWVKTSMTGDMIELPQAFEGIVRVPFNQFRQAAWQQCGTCDRPIDLQAVNTYKFGYSPKAYPGASFSIDSIALYTDPNEAAPRPAEPEDPAGSEPEPVYVPLEAPAWAKPEGTYSLAYREGPVDNPLKGFLPFSNSDKEGYFKENDDDWRETVDQLPHSMEFFYLPLKEIMKGDKQFDWSVMEQEISEIADRGNQAIFRVYLDYPNKPSGIPEFLLERGLETRAYDYFGNGGEEGTSVAPDYNDPNLMQALQDFIVALGAKYDGDPRVGFVQVGLIGFWGEWHTWPQDGYTPEDSWTTTDAAEATDGTLTDWMPTAENQEKIVDGFDEAFDETRILVRYPTSFNKDLNLGYHDDSFAFQTLPPAFGGQDWHFVGRLINNGVTEKWKTEPVGGEMRPEIQIKMWDNDPPRYEDTPIEGAQGEDFYKALELTHASWLKVQGIFQTPLAPDALERAKQASRDLGYEYHVPKAYLAAGTTGSWKVAVEVENRGVAPFYYDWQVELAAIDASGNVAKTWNVDWKLSDILPSEPSVNGNRLFEAELDTKGLAAGAYTVSMRVANPLEGGKSFRFSNASQQSDGWLNLGELAVGKGGTAEPPAPSATEYKVKPGDTLSHIAARYGTTWQKLHAFNKLKNPHRIYPGQIILIPAGTSQ
jgi:hypothetical protein